MSITSKTSTNKTIQVLHIDDNSNHLAISKRMIETLNPKIKIESVNILEESLFPLEHYDCILSDYQMPPITGIELAETIRSESNIPIILYTGHGSEKVAEAAFGVGIDDYIRKEFEPAHYQVVARRIQMAVEGYRAKKARSLLEEQNAVTLEILQTLNRTEDTKQALYAVIDRVRQYADIEFVALRLRHGNDYNYYVWKGFPDYFIKMENSLCKRDRQGDLLLDEEGEPLLECMCGNVIRGRFDPSLPFFTDGGSFWSNCTTELLASTTEEDRQSETRNTCNGEGYESVALIPLCKKGENYGLLQLCDCRKGRFSIDMMRFLEGLAESIAVAMNRIKTPSDDVFDTLDTIWAAEQPIIG